MSGLKDENLELSQLLVQKGLVTSEQMTRALEYQCRLPPGRYMSLPEVLVSFEYVTPEQIQEVQGRQLDYMDDPVCQILLKEGVISEEQLTQAMSVLNSFSKSHIGNILADLGMVSHQVIEQAISKYQLEQSGIQVEKGLQGVQETTVPEHPESDTNISNKEILTSKKPGESNSRVHLPLGRILIARGWISEQELEDALAYQSRLPEVLHKPVGEILVSLGYIQEDQLEEALAEQKATVNKNSMGHVLVQRGVISQSQLSRALSLQFQPEHATKKLGQILVELGFSTRDAIENALKAHYAGEAPEAAPAAPKPAPSSTSPKPLGQILIEKQYISAQQLQEALDEQKSLGSDYMPLGDLLILKGYLSEEQLQAALSAQTAFKKEPIGQILIRYGVIEDWQLAHALCLQHQQAEPRKSLGAILVESGYTSQEKIEAVLMKHYKSGSPDT